MSKRQFTRRAFLAATTTTALGAWAQSGTKPNTAKVVPGKISPNEKLNIAGIGVGGKGNGDIMSCSHENIVALCDVDHRRAREAFYRLRKQEPKEYWDYRKMLEEMDKEIDACTISTPDHSHAPAAAMAMAMGKHVYVQKPLTHTVVESRYLASLARDYGVATQMGNQGTSMNSIRELCELLWSGVIGDVREVHVWTDRPGTVWPQGIPNPLPEQPVRKKLDWDLWIGPAPMRPYNKGYCPRNWRGWWDFGCGAIGDMGCHNMNPAWMSLKLAGAREFTVELVQEEGNSAQTGPNSSVIKYQIPERGGLCAVDLYWHDGGLLPKHPQGVPENQVLGDGGNGSLFIGNKGVITCGVNGGESRLLPDEKMQDYTRPEASIPRIPEEDHYKNWIAACKGGAPACSNFDYAGPLTEFANMGNVALRAGKKLSWNSDELSAGDEAADKIVTKEHREGWSIPKPTSPLKWA